LIPCGLLIVDGFKSNVDDTIEVVHSINHVKYSFFIYNLIYYNNLIVKVFMSDFTIFTDDAKTVKVKNGFSWPAFFFGFFVCFYHRMYKHGWIWFGLFAFATFILPYLLGLYVGYSGEFVVTERNLDEYTQGIQGVVMVFKLIYSIMQGKVFNSERIKWLETKGLKKIS